MGPGNRKVEQRPFWIVSGEPPRSTGYPFHAALNGLLAEADFTPDENKIEFREPMVWDDKNIGARECRPTPGFGRKGRTP